MPVSHNIFIIQRGNAKLCHEGAIFVKLLCTTKLLQRYILYVFTCLQCEILLSFLFRMR